MKKLTYNELYKTIEDLLYGSEGKLVRTSRDVTCTPVPGRPDLVDIKGNGIYAYNVKLSDWEEALKKAIETNSR